MSIESGIGKEQVTLERMPDAPVLNMDNLQQRPAMVGQTNVTPISDALSPVNSGLSNNRVTSGDISPNDKITQASFPKTQPPMNVDLLQVASTIKSDEKSLDDQAGYSQATKRLPIIQEEPKSAGMKHDNALISRSNSSILSIPKKRVRVKPTPQPSFNKILIPFAKVEVGGKPTKQITEVKEEIQSVGAPETL